MKKLLAFALVTALSISLLAGCGGKKENIEPEERLPLTILALIAAAEKTGYEVDEDWSRPIGVFGDTRPIDGFFVYYTTDDGFFQIEFMEFESEDGALSYKEANDEDSNSIFPDLHVPCERFLARLSLGFGEDTDQAMLSFIDSIFEFALANPVEDDGSRKQEIEADVPDEIGKTRQEVEAMLANFSMSLIVESEQYSEPYYFTYAASDKGAFFEMKGEYSDLGLVDFAAGKGYELYPETMTGETYDLGSDEIGMAKSLPYLVAQHLFMHTMYGGFEEKGSDKLLGRSVTVYTTDEIYESKMTIWIDDEYGFALKYEITGDGGFNTLMRVTEFKIGGVNPLGMVNLNEYELEEYVEPEEEEPEIIEGVLSLAAMQKAVREAGFDENGFMMTGGYANQANQMILEIDVLDGFQIFRPVGGSNMNVINVKEFESEELAAMYFEHVISEDASLPLIAHRSGVYVVTFYETHAADLEGQIMEALKKAGWE